MINPHKKRVKIMSTFNTDFMIKRKIKIEYIKAISYSN